MLGTNLLDFKISSLYLYIYYIQIRYNCNILQRFLKNFTILPGTQKKFAISENSLYLRKTSLPLVQYCVHFTHKSTKGVQRPWMKFKGQDHTRQCKSPLFRAFILNPILLIFHKNILYRPKQFGKAFSFFAISIISIKHQKGMYIVFNTSYSRQRGRYSTPDLAERQCHSRKTNTVLQMF